MRGYRECGGMASQHGSIRPRLKLSKEIHLKSSTHQGYWLTGVYHVINSEAENFTLTDQLNFDDIMRSVFFSDCREDSFHECLGLK